MADSFKVNPLGTVDSDGHVLKDSYGQPVLDTRHTGLGHLIHRYQVRWRVIRADGTVSSPKKQFARDERDLAERLHRQLKEAEGELVWADAEGLPHGTKPKVVPANRRIDDALREYFGEELARRTSAKHKEGLETNLMKRPGLRDRSCYWVTGSGAGVF